MIINIYMSCFVLFQVVSYKQFTYKLLQIFINKYCYDMLIHIKHRLYVQFTFKCLHTLCYRSIYKHQKPR